MPAVLLLISDGPHLFARKFVLYFSCFLPRPPLCLSAPFCNALVLASDFLKHFYIIVVSFTASIREKQPSAFSYYIPSAVENEILHHSVTLKTFLLE